MDLTAIQKNLGSLRRKIRTLFMAEGLAKLLLGIGLFVIVSFALDLWLSFPRAVRGVMLAATLGALGYTVFRSLWYPARVPLTDDDLALYVERHNPMLKGRLISSLQLARTFQDDPYCSSEMVQALVAETNGVIGSVRFGDVAKAARLMLYLLLLIAVTAPIAIVGTLDNQGRLGIWFKRAVVLMDEPWPRQTSLVLTNAGAVASDVIPRGSALTVHGVASRKLPTDATFVWKTKGSDDWQAEPMTTRPRERGAHEQQFRYTLKSAADTFTFYLKAGDARTEEYTVEVVDRPKVKGNPTVTAQLPTYLPGSLRNDFAGIDRGSVADLPIGSWLTVTVEATEAVDPESVVLRFHDPESLDKVVRTQTMEPVAPANHYKTTFFVDGPLTYSLAMTRTHSRDTRRFPIDNSDKHITYGISCYVDAAPVVVVNYPEAVKFVGTQSVIPIRGAAADDYGLAAVTLRYDIRKERPRLLDKMNWKELPIARFEETDSSRSSVTFDYPLEMERLGAQEGDIIIYQVVANDHFTLEAAEEEQQYRTADQIVQREAKRLLVLPRPAGITLPDPLAVMPLEQLVAHMQTNLPPEMQEPVERDFRIQLGVTARAFATRDDAEAAWVARRGPNMGSSPRRIMEVLELYAHQKHMLEKLIRARSGLKRLYEDQIKVKDKVRYTVSEPGLYQRLKRNLRTHRDTQRFITRRLIKLEDDFERVASEFEENRVFLPQVAMIRDLVIPGLAHIADGPSPAAARKIGELDVAAAVEKKVNRRIMGLVTGVQKKQLDVMREIETLLLQLPDPGAIADALDELKSLEGRLNELQKLLDELSKEDPNPNDE